jgi:c-di-GMP-binding flagellar brake protein YcgR
VTMKETNTGAERRRYQRVEAQIPIRYRKQGDAAETPATSLLTADVSAGGLMFRTKEAISAACNLVLELDLPTVTRPILATAKVARMRKAYTGEEYEVGNEFMEITKKDQELISQFVNGYR